MTKTTLTVFFETRCIKCFMCLSDVRTLSLHFVMSRIQISCASPLTPPADSAWPQSAFWSISTLKHNKLHDIKTLKTVAAEKNKRNYTVSQNASPTVTTIPINKF